MRRLGEWIKNHPSFTLEEFEKEFGKDFRRGLRAAVALGLVVRQGELYVSNKTNTFVEPSQLASMSSPNGVEILPVRAEDYLPKRVPNYVPTDEELEIYQAHLESGIPVLVRGPKGTGKTLSIAYFAWKNKIPIIQFDCSENTKRFDLIGRFILRGEEVKYLLGAMPTAIEVANQYGSAILVLEELNALSPQMQKVLNQLLDWRRHVYIPEIGITYELRDKVKLLIAATMNPTMYGGVFELNEDLKSRFVELFLGYPQEEKEVEIVRANIEDDNMDKGLYGRLVLLAKETRAGVNEGELSYALSPRDLVLVAQAFKTYKGVFGSEEEALKQALKVAVLNRYEDKAERETAKARIQSIFGLYL